MKPQMHTDEHRSNAISTFLCGSTLFGSYSRNSRAIFHPCPSVFICRLVPLVPTGRGTRLRLVTYCNALGYGASVSVCPVVPPFFFSKTSKRGVSSADGLSFRIIVCFLHVFQTIILSRL